MRIDCCAAAHGLLHGGRSQLGSSNRAVVLHKIDLNHKNRITRSRYKQAHKAKQCAGRLGDRIEIRCCVVSLLRAFYFCDRRRTFDFQYIRHFAGNRLVSEKTAVL